MDVGNQTADGLGKNLGFVVGGTCKLISVINGNVIVKVKESRIAISGEMAQKIMV